MGIEDLLYLYGDLVALVVDKSASQTLDGRDKTTAAAEAALKAELGAFHDVSVRTVEAGGATGGAPVDGTQLFGPLATALADVPAEQVGGVIMLTDGQRTTGPDAVEAAKVAAAHGVRVYTVGIGTPEGEIMSFEGWRMRVKLDEETLKNVAMVTHGEYFYAGDAAELRKVYQSLTSRFTLEKKETEVTALFSALAAILAVTSALLSLAWFNRIL